MVRVSENLKAEAIPQILPPRDDTRDERAFGVARQQLVDQIDLIHRDQLQHLVAHSARSVARQCFDNLNALRLGQIERK